MNEQDIFKGALSLLPLLSSIHARSNDDRLKGFISRLSNEVCTISIKLDQDIGTLEINRRNHKKREIIKVKFCLDDSPVVTFVNRDTEKRFTLLANDEHKHKDFRKQLINDLEELAVIHDIVVKNPTTISFILKQNEIKNLQIS